MLELGDQILESAGLLGQIDGARALGGQRLLALRLLLLALADQRAHARALVTERGDLLLERIALVVDLLAHGKQPAQVSRQSGHLVAHFRQHRAEHHGGADRLQRIFRAGDEGGRRAAADALERRQHFADDIAPARERGADRRFLRIERLQARLGVGHFGLDLAQLGGGVDERLVELAAIIADLLDLTLDLGLGLGRFLLLIAQRLELVVVLLEQVGLVAALRLRRLGRLLRGGGRRRGEAQRRNQRGAGVETARSEGNHCGKVRPGRRRARPPVGRFHARRLRPNEAAGA